MDHSIKAGELFLGGCNCAQAVFLAFTDLTGFDNKTAAKISAPFGGGMGRMREVCGAVSGMFMVLGTLYGYDDTVTDDAQKKEHYKDVQALAAKFKEECGSIICREILKNPPSDPTPTPRDAEFYKVRPCARMVMTAARILDEYIAEHPLNQQA